MAPWWLKASTLRLIRWGITAAAFMSHHDAAGRGWVRVREKEGEGKDNSESGGKREEGRTKGRLARRAGGREAGKEGGRGARREAGGAGGRQGAREGGRGPRREAGGQEGGKLSLHPLLFPIYHNVLQYITICHNICDISQYM